MAPNGGEGLGGGHVEAAILDGLAHPVARVGWQIEHLPGHNSHKKIMRTAHHPRAGMARTFLAQSIYKTTMEKHFSPMQFSACMWRGSSHSRLYLRIGVLW